MADKTKKPILQLQLQLTHRRVRTRDIKRPKTRPVMPKPFKFSDWASI
ncbi:MAG: hypothetical protein ACR2PF_01875 [Rhizobiaceae bacterium]